MAKFLVITGDNCSYCTKAKELLTERGHTFTEVDLLDAQERMKRTGRNTVPQIFRMDESDSWPHIGGYTDLVAYLGLS
jgi:glutaredoxin 3